MKFSILSSGSRANCIFVSAGGTRILVDCGLSCRETERRLRVAGIEPRSIQALLLTHEHGDHLRGIPLFSQKYKIPLYTNLAEVPITRELEPFAVERFRTGQKFTIGDLEIESFSIMHDAEDPVGFRLSGGGFTLGLVTDLGQVTSLVRERVGGLDAIILESNHDLDMLMNEAPYPWPLKQRIRGSHGHLSNDAAADLITELAGEPSRLQYLIAAHISEKSNRPEIALNSVKMGWKRGQPPVSPEFIAASAFHPTPVLTLQPDYLQKVSLVSDSQERGEVLL